MAPVNAGAAPAEVLARLGADQSAHGCGVVTKPYFSEI